jgi:DNA anti-recombination protein RmuC
MTAQIIKLDDYRKPENRAQKRNLSNVNIAYYEILQHYLREYDEDLKLFVLHQNLTTYLSHLANHVPYKHQSTNIVHISSQIMHLYHVIRILSNDIDKAMSALKINSEMSVDKITNSCIDYIDSSKDLQ